MNTPSTDLHGLARTTDTASTSRVAAPPSRWKTRVLLPGLIGAMVVILLLVTSARTLLPATPVHVIPVVVKTIDGAAGTVTVQAPGWLEPNPHPYYVTALADGVVAEMLALEGDRVIADQIVARLIDDDAKLALQRAEGELLRQRSTLLAAQAELAGDRLELEHLIDVTREVDVARAVVAETRADIETAKAIATVEQAKLDEVRDEHDRKSKLTDSQAVSEATVARLRLRMGAQAAAVDAAGTTIRALEATLGRADADLAAATTRRALLIDERRAVAVAEARVGTAEGLVALAKAARDQAALRLDRMEVRSPVGGVVMRRLTSPGSQVRVGGDKHSSHVIHIYDPAHMQVRIDVPLANAAKVTVGQAAEIVVEVLPDRTFTGIVSRIVHEADIVKNSIEVKVALHHPSPDLKPDMLARAKFLARNEPGGGALRQRVFAPAALVRDDGSGGSVAWVVSSLVDERGRVERRVVTPGSRRVDGWIEIESGLQVGDLLVADPSADLEPGDRIRVVGEQALSVGGGP